MNAGMTNTQQTNNQQHRHFGARASANSDVQSHVGESRDSGSGAGAPSRNDGVTNIDQDQFLTILSREDAVARFEAALFPRPLSGEPRPLADALGCALAEDIVAPIDVPPFDRSNVDGFAVRSADLASAAEATPVRLMLNDEVIACGTAPTRPVLLATATSIATGGPVPRGADAIVMVEHTQPVGSRAIEIRRAASPGQYVAYAGSDIARGEALLRAGTVIGSREIGMLAACGIAQVMVARRTRVAVISTGDELVQPGEALRPAAIYDTNGAIVTAAISENGGDAMFLGAVADDEDALEAAMRAALAISDVLVLSGGTSKGAGDVSHRIIARLGKPGIIAHGVALKPGKPLCLAVCDGKPVVILPGFPTSAMFTFHDMIGPVLRRMAGLPPRPDAKVTARVPVRIASEIGRTEFVMVSLVEGADGLIAYPTSKGSGAITSFAQADGFVRIDALADQMPAGTPAEVTLFTPHVRVPDLVIVGSHCTGLDLVTAPLARAGFSVRSIAIGSLGGLAAARRGECDFAPIHLFDEKTETYNTPFLMQGLELVPGWRRMQGIVFRQGDARFEGLSAEAAVRSALADPACIMVNRNQGAGTRILIDRLLGAARPDGYWNQPRSHNAVAAAVAQHRADWGMTIAPVAHASSLGFIPLAEEHYDFALVSARKQRPAVQAFLQALMSDESRAALAQAGFRPA
jgi:molybdenum cofactor synthesis domain-containing protein